jgi:hypothetical protein
VRTAAQAAVTRVVLSQGAPWRARVERRLPALSSLRGHSPAQEIRWGSGGEPGHVPSPRPILPHALRPLHPAGSAPPMGNY